MAITIDLEVIDKGATKKIDNMIEAVKHLDESLGGAADSMERLNKSGGKAGASLRRASGGGGGRGMRFTKGPHQTLIDLAQQESMLSSVTDPAQRSAISADIQRKKFLANRSITLQNRRNADPNSATAPGLLELFNTLNNKIGGLGGKGGSLLKGLGGKGAAGAAAGGAAAGGLASLAAIAGPAAAVLAIFALEVKAVSAAFKSFIAQGVIVGRGAAVTGGDAAAFQSIRGIAKFLGVDPSQLANTLGGGATGIRGSTIAGIPGASPLPQFARTMSNAENVRIIIDYLTSPSISNRLAQQTAQRIGPDAQAVLWMRNLTERSRQRLFTAGEGMVTPEQSAAAAEFKASMVHLGFAFERLKSSVIIVKFVEALTTSLDGLAIILDLLANKLQRFASRFGFDSAGGKNIAQTADEQTARNTKALNQNSERLAQNTETMGGGRRAQSALPPGYINNIIFNNGAPGAIGFGLL